jgi:hypothetical protein
MATQPVISVKKFTAAPGAEVLGAAMLSLPQCLNADEIMPLFAKRGIAEVDAQKWYPQQVILDIYKDIVEGRSNVSENLVSIGVKSADTMLFPPEINSVETVVSALAGSYTAFHRNVWPDEGTIVRFLGEGHAQAILNIPYPDDIFYGYFWALLKKYTPKGKKFRLSYVDPIPELPGTVCDFRWGMDV